MTGPYGIADRVISIRVTYSVWFRSSVNFNHVDPEIFLLHELLRA